MVFMHHKIRLGRNLSLFNVIDDFNREVLSIEVDTSLLTELVIRALIGEIISLRGKSQVISGVKARKSVSGTKQHEVKYGSSDLDASIPASRSSTL
jgi:transposase InsO family protein